MSALNTIGLAPDWAEIRDMVSQGFIAERPHSEDPELRIYNYTAKAQYEKRWNASTLMCRGLIARGETVIARPFQKFFNLHEHAVEDVPLHKPYRVQEKLDGSLGISYWINGEMRISTRGSMESPQALEATRMLRDWYDQNEVDDSLTYLFEIIYPENRIVVDYGDRRDLVLLATLDTMTGEEAFDCNHPFRTVEHHGDSIGLTAIEDRPNAEGYVLVFESGFRVKIKHDEYARLHKIVTGTSSRTVWEYLSQGRDLSELLDNVPDEFYQWLRNQIDELSIAFADIEQAAKRAFDAKPETNSRKEIAAAFKQHKELMPILFLMLDGRAYGDHIWKMVKPDRTLPYVPDDAAEISA